MAAMGEGEPITPGHRAFGELRSSGLLWLINASVFHPRGVALALIFGEDDPNHLNPIGWRLVSAGGDEPWHFVDSPEIDELFRAARETVARALQETS